MKVKFKVKMKATIEFLVDIYFRNDLYFFEESANTTLTKSFSWLCQKRTGREASQVALGP